jgi:septum site-determining protein MinC
LTKIPSMPAKPSGEPRTPLAANFEIKSAQLPLVALLVKNADFAAVARDLQVQFGPDSESADFFEREPVVLDFSTLTAETACPDLPILGNAVRSCGLVPVAFRSAPSSWNDSLEQMGWVETQVEPIRPKAETLPKATASDTTATAVVAGNSPAVATMVIDKPLRSGQKVYARGGDLVVLAMVNQGAEVVADGNIHVYAPLRGKAMAGARGNAQARIFSLCLEPELISIAGVYRTSENPLPKDIAGKAAQVRLSTDGQDKLIIEALKT